MWFWKRNVEAIPMDSARSGRGLETAAAEAARERTAATSQGNQAGSVDPFLASIAAERTVAQSEAEAAFKRHASEMGARFGESLQLKARLAAFVRENHLDRALQEIWDAIKYYPAWSTRPDFAKWNKLALEGISGSSDLGSGTVSFLYGGHRFVISEKKFQGMESYYSYCEIAIVEEDEEMFAVRYSIDHKPDYTTLGYMDLCAFKKKGTWANMLLRLHALAQLEQQKYSNDSKYFRAEEIPSRFVE